MARKRGNRNGRRHHHASDFPFPDITGPPPGTYDPGLQAQIEQAQRGLLDTQQDVHTDIRHARRDTQTTIHGERRDTHRSMQDARRTRHQSLQNLGLERHGTNIDFARNLYDLGVAQQRGTQDFQTATENLNRKYDILGIRQAESANARGIGAEGGAAAASAAKRTANQATEQRPLQTDFERMMADEATKRARAQQDHNLALQRYGIQGQRIHTDFSRSRERLHQDLHHNVRMAQRSLSDTLQADRRRRSRAVREFGQYALDQTQQEFYQAHQQHPYIHFPTVPQLQGGVTPHGHPIG